MERLTDKIRGCLVGGAIGDALGYSVEFITYPSIIRQYGSDGITSFTLEDNLALFSDDTPMTLFTANGLEWKRTELLDKRYSPIVCFTGAREYLPDGHPATDNYT